MGFVGRSLFIDFNIFITFAG